MTIQFRKLDPSDPEEDEQRPAATDVPADFPPLPPLAQAQVEETLFFFLQALLAGRYRAIRPLLFSQETLHALLQQSPHPPLHRALQHNVDHLLAEIDPRSTRKSQISVPPHVWSLAAAALNCLLPRVDDPVLDFTRALLPAIPPARTVGEALVYHAVLEKPAAALADWPADAVRTPMMHALIRRSPLTALYHLHLHTPPPLTELAADLLPWQRRADPAPWAGLAQWIEAVAALLERGRLAAYLRRRWLSLPQTQPACRNLGLTLEALRRHGRGRDATLQFYEAYQYRNAVIVPDGRGAHYRRWPLLERIEKLLRADGAEKVARTLNRIGGEYFLLFWPLLQYAIAEGRLPPAYEYLTREFLWAIRSLWDLAPVGGDGVELSMGEITFTSEDAT
jgi:hypothetical protein